VFYLVYLVFQFGVRVVFLRWIVSNFTLINAVF
jgi:hypothetical protein